MQIGRMVVLAAGLPYTVPGQTVNRWCSSGLQSIALAAERIMAGFADVIVAGGVESMSSAPLGGLTFSANPTLALEYPSAYVGMGLTAENVAEQYGVSREDQDAFRCAHQRGGSHPRGKVHGRGRPCAGARDLGGR